MLFSEPKYQQINNINKDEFITIKLKTNSEKSMQYCATLNINNRNWSWPDNKSLEIL